MSTQTQQIQTTLIKYLILIFKAEWKSGPWNTFILVYYDLLGWNKHKYTSLRHNYLVYYVGLKMTVNYEFFNELSSNEPTPYFNLPYDLITTNKYK